MVNPNIRAKGHVGQDAIHPNTIQKHYQLHFDKVWRNGILNNAYDFLPHKVYKWTFLSRFEFDF
jgi:hypothetical protein